MDPLIAIPSNPVTANSTQLQPTRIPTPSAAGVRRQRAASFSKEDSDGVEEDNMLPVFQVRPVERGRRGSGGHSAVSVSTTREPPHATHSQTTTVSGGSSSNRLRNNSMKSMEPSQYGMSEGEIGGQPSLLHAPPATPHSRDDEEGSSTMNSPMARTEGTLPPSDSFDGVDPAGLFHGHPADGMPHPRQSAEEGRGLSKVKRESFEAPTDDEGPLGVDAPYGAVPSGLAETMSPKQSSMIKEAISSQNKLLPIGSPHTASESSAVSRESRESGPARLVETSVSLISEAHDKQGVVVSVAATNKHSRESSHAPSDGSVTKNDVSVTRSVSADEVRHPHGGQGLPSVRNVGLERSSNSSASAPSVADLSNTQEPIATPPGQQTKRLRQLNVVQGPTTPLGVVPDVGSAFAEHAENAQHQQQTQHIPPVSSVALPPRAPVTESPAKRLGSRGSLELPADKPPPAPPPASAPVSAVTTGGSNSTHEPFFAIYNASSRGERDGFDRSPTSSLNYSKSESTARNGSTTTSTSTGGHISSAPTRDAFDEMLGTSSNSMQTRSQSSKLHGSLNTTSSSQAGGVVSAPLGGGDEESEIPSSYQQFQKVSGQGLTVPSGLSPRSSAQFAPTKNNIAGAAVEQHESPFSLFEQDSGTGTGGSSGQHNPSSTDTGASNPKQSSISQNATTSSSDKMASVSHMSDSNRPLATLLPVQQVPLEVDTTSTTQTEHTHYGFLSFDPPENLINQSPAQSTSTNISRSHSRAPTGGSAQTSSNPTPSQQTQSSTPAPGGTAGSPGPKKQVKRASVSFSNSDHVSDRNSQTGPKVATEQTRKPSNSDSSGLIGQSPKSPLSNATYDNRTPGAMSMPKIGGAVDSSSTTQNQSTTISVSFGGKEPMSISGSAHPSQSVPVVDFGDVSGMQQNGEVGGTSKPLVSLLGSQNPQQQQQQLHQEPRQTVQQLVSGSTSPVALAHPTNTTPQSSASDGMPLVKSKGGRGSCSHSQERTTSLFGDQVLSIGSTDVGSPLLSTDQSSAGPAASNSQSQQVNNPSGSQEGTLNTSLGSGSPPGILKSPPSALRKPTNTVPSQPMSDSTKQSSSTNSGTKQGTSSGVSSAGACYSIGVTPATQSDISAPETPQGGIVSSSVSAGTGTGTATTAGTTTDTGAKSGHGKSVSFLVQPVPRVKSWMEAQQHVNSPPEAIISPADSSGNLQSFKQGESSANSPEQSIIRAASGGIALMANSGNRVGMIAMKDPARVKELIAEKRKKHQQELLLQQQQVTQSSPSTSTKSSEVQRTPVTVVSTTSAAPRQPEEKEKMQTDLPRPIGNSASGTSGATSMTFTSSDKKSGRSGSTTQSRNSMASVSFGALAAESKVYTNQFGSEPPKRGVEVPVPVNKQPHETEQQPRQQHHGDESSQMAGSVSIVDPSRKQDSSVPSLGNGETSLSVAPLVLPTTLSLKSLNDMPVVQSIGTGSMLSIPTAQHVGVGGGGGVVVPVTAGEGSPELRSTTIGLPSTAKTPQGPVPAVYVNHHQGTLANHPPVTAGDLPSLSLKSGEDDFSPPKSAFPVHKASGMGVTKPAHVLNVTGGSGGNSSNTDTARSAGPLSAFSSGATYTARGSSGTNTTGQEVFSVPNSIGQTSFNSGLNTSGNNNTSQKLNTSGNSSSHPAELVPKPPVVEQATPSPARKVSSRGVVSQQQEPSTTTKTRAPLVASSPRDPAPPPSKNPGPKASPRPPPLQLSAGINVKPFVVGAQRHSVANNMGPETPTTLVNTAGNSPLTTTTTYSSAATNPNVNFTTNPVVSMLPLTDLVYWNSNQAATTTGSPGSHNGSTTGASFTLSETSVSATGGAQQLQSRNTSNLQHKSSVANNISLNTFSIDQRLKIGGSGGGGASGSVVSNNTGSMPFGISTASNAESLKPLFSKLLASIDGVNNSNSGGSASNGTSRSLPSLPTGTSAQPQPQVRTFDGHHHPDQHPPNQQQYNNSVSYNPERSNRQQSVTWNASATSVSGTRMSFTVPASQSHGLDTSFTQPK